MYLWNQYKSGIVNLDKVRNFSIRPTAAGIEVIAWFSDSESVSVGNFNNDAEAEGFLEKIVGSNTKPKK